MKLKEFMVQSKTGRTHAINPKTMKTYCGYPRLTPTVQISELSFEDIGWRFLDVVPSDRHKPTCSICAAHYDDPLNEELSKIAGELKESIDEFLSSTLILKDVEALGRFTELVAKFMREEKRRRQSSG